MGMDVSLQLLSYAEPYDRVTDTMDAWAACQVPDTVDQITYEAAVTPAPDDTIRDLHPDAARDHELFDLHVVPGGKLTARNRAHNAAVDRGDDVIITTDVDAPPLREDVLGALLAPYDDPGVVATNSVPVAVGPIGLAVNLLALVEDIARPHMHGQLSSFTADSWAAVGPFPVGELDETNIRDVRAVEEIGLHRDLSQLGTVVSVPEARVLNDTRRVTCLFEDVRPGAPRYDFCRQRGESTFAPRR